MTKEKEVYALADELNKCSEILKEISLKLKDVLEYEREAQETKEEKKLSLEDVRKVLADKSRLGYTSKIKELLEKYGACKLSEIDSNKYKDLVSDVEKL